MTYLLRWQAFYLLVKSLLSAFCFIMLFLLSSIWAEAQVSENGAREYKTVHLFEDRLEIIIPKKFKKLKKRELQDSIPFVVTDRIGFHDQNIRLKFFATNNVFPGADEIGIWEIFDSVVVSDEPHTWMFSGYTMVNNQFDGRSRPLYFVRFKYFNTDNQTEYKLVYCLEVNGRIMIGIFRMPDAKTLEQYEKDFAMALKLKD